MLNQKRNDFNFQQIFCAVILFLCLSNVATAQNGMNFQGVARNTSGIILASQPIAVRLSILQGSTTGTVLYQETKTVTTNAQGIFNIVIGDPTGATSTTGSYTNIAWQTPPHFIRLEMDPSAGTNFATLGTTQLQFVAYAQFANGVAAENIVGLVPVARGGTGASNLQDLKQNLQLNNVNNTSDLNKPISTATQTALNAKINAADTTSLSSRINQKINIEDSASAYITPMQLNNAFQRLDTSHVYRAIASKASLVSPQFLSDINVNGLTVGRGNGNVLSNIALGDFALNSDSASAGENNIGIGVQTLRYNNGGTRNVAVGNRALYSNGNSSKMTAIGVNADVLNPGLSLSNSTALGFGAIVDESNLIQLGNSDIQKVRTSGVVTAAGFKIPAGSGNDVLLANGTTLNTSVLEQNNNKSTDILLGGTSPSDILYPSQKAVKAYVAANSASGSIADGGITTIKLADGAVTDAKVTSISGSKITGNITGATWSGTVIDIAKGGTGSSTKNFVDLTTTQTIAGNKTFSGTTNFTTDAIINSVTIGLGNNANIDNLVVGKDALITNTTGYSNLALGMNSLKSNTTGDGNIALGFGALFNNITGTSNIAIGRGALSSSTSGSRNIAIGDGLNMYGLTTGNENTSLGNGTLVNVSSGSHNTALGASANITDGTISNTTVIGYNALASTSNTIQLGNTEITSVITSGVVSATGFRGPLTGNASSATTAITAGNISATSNTTLTSLSNLNTVGTITSGVWSGTVIDIAKGGTGATNAAGARANLGLVIGTDIMAANATTKLTGDITGTGTGTFTTTLSNTGVTAGTYGSSNTVPVLTIDAKGRVTNITTNAVSGGGSSDAATLTGNTLASNITISSLTGVGTITTGTWSGTVIDIAKGGTGATNAAGARSKLGLVIGSDILAYRTFGTAANSSATDFIAANASITGATKTKITYDTKGLITAGADATTTDIAPSTNRNYVTDVQAVVISNTSGVNTGDETTSSIKSKLGITTLSGSNTGDQTNVTGNAGTASKLAIARKINNVDFDGSVDITVNVDAGTLTGTTLNSTVTESSLTSVGVISSGTWRATTIAVNKGGTGLTSTGTNGQVLTSTGSGTLTWTTPVFLPTIVIGTQQWMRENLDVMTYRNGDVIPQVTDATEWAGLTTGAWCYYNNDPLNGAIYGKLYNWYAVNDPRGLAPQGWHIPTDAEWTTLGTLLGVTDGLGYNWVDAGGKMKTPGITRWTTPNTSATNESGFAGLPGGYRYAHGPFNKVSEFGFWWSATETSADRASVRNVAYNSSTLWNFFLEKKYGYSVRCLRD